MVSYNIDLNIKEITSIDTGIQVTQGDYGQIQFLMRVRDNDDYIMDATKAQIVFTLPDGYVVSGDVAINAGTYTYTFKGNELQSAGKISAVLTLTYANGRVSSCGFTFNCRHNPLYDRHLNAGAYIPELERIVEQAKGQISYLENLIAQLQGDVGETALTRDDLISDGRQIAAGLAAMDASMAKGLLDTDKSHDRSIQNLTDLVDKLNGNMVNINDKLGGMRIRKISYAPKLSTPSDRFAINIPSDIPANSIRAILACNKNGIDDEAYIIACKGGKDNKWFAIGNKSDTWVITISFIIFYDT